MKCQKCNYTSFDHNEICPKCKQDISSERDRMRHPKYKENPLFLLGALIGESEASDTKPSMGYTRDAGISSGPVPAEEVTREDEFILEPDFRPPRGYDVERPVDSESLELDGEIDFSHLDALLEDDSELNVDEGSIREDEDYPELEPLDSIRRGKTEGLDLSPAADQEDLETLELDLEPERSKNKSS
ncbi:MAG: hypothetical protein V1689_14230 [Pseudomonadota bacterium]